jgi:hypothetical protein
MAYTDPKEYLKFKSASGCGCGETSTDPCNDCNDCKDNDCSCCPPGLVAIYDDKGAHTGCVTANDAELYQKNTFTCQDGYVKLCKVSKDTGEVISFLGCVSETEFAALYTAVNP